MKKQAGLTKEKLDQVALDIEFLLISVIQGVAVATLATAAVTPIERFEFLFFPYILTAFLLILVFWANAIIHAISFIDWPLDLSHSFLYFLASFVEVMAISHITNPLMWYVSLLVFQIVAGVLYWYDLRLITKRIRRNTTSEQKKLFSHIRMVQQHELNVYIPAAIVFNFFAVAAIVVFPSLFLGNNLHILLILLQLFFVCIFLHNILKNFQKRITLITATSR